MKADISRLTFDPLAHFARVMQQQGRPVLDADWNEQVAILLHRSYLLARDLIGPYGGPIDTCGFAISSIDGGPHDFEIGAGRYYVNGMCCENATPTRFSTQPVPVGDAGIVDGKTYLVFLDVWEEFVTACSEPNLIEPALGGLDTTGRTRIAWQVRTLDINPKWDGDYVIGNWPAISEMWQPPMRGRLQPRLRDDQDDDEFPAQYRGEENQLYRIEIHYGGKATSGADGATFKWSRDNGSVVMQLGAIKGNILTLDRLDSSGIALAADDWLEEVTPYGSHSGTPRRPLIRVVGRGPGRDQVTIDAATLSSALDPTRAGGVWLRRWDQRSVAGYRGGSGLRDGALLIKEGKGDAGWIVLEQGIEVQFAPGATYRPGDYWTIPARAADGGRLLWPEDGNAFASVAPHGNRHNYAPLAIVTFRPIADVTTGCRLGFKPLAGVRL